MGLGGGYSRWDWEGGTAVGGTGRGYSRRGTGRGGTVGGRGIQ